MDLMNILLLVLVFFCILIFFLKSKKNKKVDHRFNRNSTLEKSNSGELRYIASFLDPLIDKIDLNMDYSFVSHSNVRLKCIMAGIRNPKKQKMIIFLRYALILPFSLSGILAAQMFLGDSLKTLIITMIAGGILGFFFPVIRLDSVIKNRQDEIERVFPDFVDLMTVCVEAGMTAEQAYVRISDDLKEFSEVMAEEIVILSAETTYFLEIKIAYDNFIYRTQSPFVKAFCSVVVQSIQFGTPLSKALKALSEEIRESQMGKIERKAQALPSKLTVPMMLFTLPVLFVVIAYPAAKQVMESF